MLDLDQRYSPKQTHQRIQHVIIRKSKIHSQEVSSYKLRWSSCSRETECQADTRDHTAVHDPSAYMHNCPTLGLALRDTWLVNKGLP